MRERLREQRVFDWNRDVYERVGTPLHPEAVRSVFIIVPGSSGDVALATTVVRHIKDRNPDCRISFASKRANLPLLRMCPGIDEVVESPTVTFDVTPARRIWRERYSGRAEVVIHPVCLFEDQGLMRRYNFLETIWLLSGVPDGMPDGPHRLWLTPPPNSAELAAGAIRRSLGAEGFSALVAQARAERGKILKRMVEYRNVKNAGWKLPVRLRKHAEFVKQIGDIGDPLNAAERFVIVSNEAGAVPPAPEGLFEEIVRFLRSRGRIVLQNVLDPLKALPGTVPLKSSYEEFVSLRAEGIPFVGWRSGLCDIAAASQAPMCVLYPPRIDDFWIGMAVNCETCLKSFGFGSMNIAANCVEADCYGVQDLDLSKLAAILDPDQSPLSMPSPAMIARQG